MKLPADEEGAKARLSSSPRHSEWVKVNVTGGPPVNTICCQATVRTAAEPKRTPAATM